MKTLYGLVILTISSCNNHPMRADEKLVTDTTRTATTETYKTKNSKYYSNQDSIRIETQARDTLIYAKADFNAIVNKHPEFFQTDPEHPDMAYHNNSDVGEFGSEVGQDCYYILYAYFLKQKNGNEEYAQQRKKLIEIYSIINSLFGHFQNGGTFFGHQGSRILGYAEYSIYLLPKSKQDIEKTYDISRQKEFYIKSLRQLIADESKIDFNTMGKDKAERNKALYNIVDELNKLITDIFYLRRAQEFQYSHYEYY